MCKNPFYTKDNRIDGKVVIITGANTGIGKVTALELAKRGGIIYLACRDDKRGSEAEAEIRKESGSQTVYFRKCDLGSLKSVIDFVNIFKSEQTKLHILINNAGIAMTPYAVTEDGFERQLGVNHLGHFLLTLNLLDLLKNSAPSRIISVSSKAHEVAKIKKDDLMSLKSYGKLEAYGQSKLANILFMKELGKRVEGSGVTTYSLHPGIVDTEINRSFGWMKYISVPLFWPVTKTAVQGAQTTIYLALDPDVEKESGKYYSDMAERKVAKIANDEDLAKWLWEESVKLTNAYNC